MGGVVKHFWTHEQKEYLKEITPGKSRKEIKELVNVKFNLNLNLNQINYAMVNNKIKTGVDSKFKKGYKAGTHKRKGPSKPVGTEKTCVDGYIKIKISENEWKHKHQYVWEQYHGEIPKGHNIIFLDKNKNNFDINNLAAVSKKELLFINNKGFLKEDTDLSKVGVALAKLMIKAKELEKK